MWWIYALLSALFAALTTVLAKIGVERVDSNLATEPANDFWTRVMIILQSFSMGRTSVFLVC